MTIERARELLGTEGDGMTDTQIEELLASMDVLADMVIDLYIEKHRRTSPTAAHCRQLKQAA
jgi:hypothetical protein